LIAALKTHYLMCWIGDARMGDMRWLGSDQRVEDVGREKAARKARAAPTRVPSMPGSRIPAALSRRE
jgi:hypothetical protein